MFWQFSVAKLNEDRSILYLECFMIYMSFSRFKAIVRISDRNCRENERCSEQAGKTRRHSFSRSLTTSFFLTKISAAPQSECLEQATGLLSHQVVLGLVKCKFIFGRVGTLFEIMLIIKVQHFDKAL